MTPLFGFLSFTCIRERDVMGVTVLTTARSRRQKTVQMRFPQQRWPGEKEHQIPNQIEALQVAGCIHPALRM